ncbi:MAG: cupin domain-containing protein [Phycisphaeraceae bacterium]|nr:cupin domain-containing protein [Phycisphaeraceae bacterium]
MSEDSPVLIPDLALHIQVPPDGTLSVTLCQNDSVKVVLFGFAAGQELSEHTASVPAIMQQISGQAVWTLGDDRKRTVDADPGTWVHMPARLPHSVRAKTPTVMLLTMLTRGG